MDHLDTGNIGHIKHRTKQKKKAKTQHTDLKRRTHQEKWW
jgi:hypothetical protein